VSTGPASAPRIHRDGSLRALAVLGVVLTAALTGCGGKSDAKTALVSAARATLGETALTTTTLAGSSLFGSVRGPVVAPGEFAFPGGVGYEALHLDRLVGQLPRTDFLLFLPTALYLEPHPARGSVLPAGKLWLHASFTGNGDPRAAPPPGFAGEAEALNPALPLSELVWGTKTVTPGRRRVLDHVPYTEYVATVDLERALAAASGKTAPALRAAIQDQIAALRSSRGAGARTIQIRAWVDGPGHVTRLQTSPPGARLGTATTMLGNFGVKVPTSVPAASEVLPVRSATPRGTSPWTIGNGSQSS